MASKTTSTDTGQRANHIFLYDAQAFGNSDVIIAGPAALQAVVYSSKAASVLWLMLFDSATVPGNGAVPFLAPIAVPVNTTARLVLNDDSGNFFDGPQLKSGLSWAASTTAGTLTIDSTNSVWVSARYLA